MSDKICFCTSLERRYSQPLVHLCFWVPLDLDSYLDQLNNTGLTKAFQRLSEIYLERLHHQYLKYCSNAKCATPFDFSQDPDIADNPRELRVTCPLCSIEKCVKCHSKWYAGTTCEENEEGSSEREYLIRLVAENDRKYCPGCNFLVERELYGCYFVRCRCGAQFYHNCQIEYGNMKEISNQVHCEPECNCGLFGHCLNKFLNIGKWRTYGYVALRDWIDDFKRRKKLSEDMRIDLQLFTCPYRGCKSEFGSCEALEHHSEDLNRHHFCFSCGRPFYTGRSKIDRAWAVHDADI